MGVDKICVFLFGLFLVVYICAFPLALIVVEFSHCGVFLLLPK